MVKRLWKLSKIFGSISWKILEIFLALILVVGEIILYQLHKEPIDAMKYVPEIEKVLLPSDSGYHIQADSFILSSDLSRDGLIQIDIKNIKVLRGNNTVLFSAPSAYFAYDIWHILTLNYMPSTIVVEKPFLEMTIDKQGTMVVKAQESTTSTIDISTLKKMIEKVLAIRELNIMDMHFHLKDDRFAQEWDLSDSNLELKRRFRFSNHARLNATLVGAGIKSRFLATAKFNRWTRTLSVETGVDEINLKKLSDFIPVLQEANLTVQFSAKAEFDVAKNHQQITDYISKLQFNAKTLKAGTLNLMGDLDNVYFIDSADINGILGQKAKVLKIASSKIKLKDEEAVDFYLDVLGINDFINKGDLSQLKTTLRASLYNIPTEQIPFLWPSKQGPDAHAWVKNNLSKGKLNQADFSLYFTGDELVDLFGDIHATGIHVDYLNPMTAVDNVSAQVLLYPDKVNIIVEKGNINNLILNKADLLFSDLDKDDSWLQIDLDINGPVPEALTLISSKPLEFPQMFNLKPSMVSGQANTLVHLSFPLLEDLSVTDVQAIVHADITEAKLNKPLEKLGLKDGHLILDVTNEYMEISGEMQMKNSLLKVFWHEYFEVQDKTADYALSGQIQGEDLFYLIPDLGPWITGKIGVDLTATKDQKNIFSGILKLDAKSATINFIPLAVQKKSDSPMTATFQLSNINEKKGNISWDVLGSLSGKQEDLKIIGSADWSKQNLHVVLKNLLAGANQFSAELNSTPSDFSLSLKGKNWQAYDLSKISFKNGTTSSESSIPQNISLDIHLDSLSLNKAKPFKEISIDGKRKNNLWTKFHAQALASAPFVLVYNEKQNQFQGSFSDLGDLIDRFGGSDRFSGGAISFVADQTKEGILEGKIEMDKIELKETGFLLQAMTILGIVDAFRGKDMVFDEAKVPFQLTPDFKLSISDAFMGGTNLGITLNGQINSSGLDLVGAVVPAYAINSLPGKIPLLGWLFRDSEGGGLINVPFEITGSLSSPEIEWNVLRTVAPGVFGRLF